MAAQLSEIQVYVLREIVEGRLSPGDRIDEAADIVQPLLIVSTI